MKIKSRKKFLIPVTALILCLIAAGCGDTNTNSNNDKATEAAQDALTEIADNIEAAEAGENDTQAASIADDNSASATSLDTSSTDYFSDRDMRNDYDENDCIKISLKDDSAECDSASVDIDGGTVTIKSEGTYLLSGELDDGMIIIDVEDSEKVQLVFDGATINSKTSAAIYVRQADKVFITTAQGSENTLSNGGEFVAIDDNNIDAVIFSKDDITLNGLGTLTINSPAGHGVVSKDSLTVTSGTYIVSAASHGLNGKDDICIINASFDITSGKDGIHAENTDDEADGFVYIESGTFKITSDGDGISGAAFVLVEDGDFDITAGGGSENAEAHANRFGGGGFGGMQPGNGGSDDNGTGFGGGRPDGGGHGGMKPGNGGMRPGDNNGDAQTDISDESASTKGIKSAGDMTINGGTFKIDSADDAIHSNTSITVKGGTFEISSGDDGFHADETLTVDDGTINIKESYEGLEGLDVVINGGDITLVATDDGVNAAGGNDQSGFGGFGFGGKDNFGSSGSSGSKILITGGKLAVTASGDALDSNGSLEITGGYITTTGPTNGDTSILDYESSGTITGGTFIGTGAQGMSESFTDASQGFIYQRLDSNYEGETVTLSDANGKELLSYTPDLSFNLVTISSPDMVSGQEYILTIGSNSMTVTAQ